MTEDAYLDDDALFRDEAWTVRLHRVITAEYGEDVRIGKLRRTNDAEFLRVPGLGRTSLKELRSVIGPYIFVDQTPRWICFAVHGLKCPACGATVAQAHNDERFYIPLECKHCGYPKERDS